MKRTDSPSTGIRISRIALDDPKYLHSFPLDLSVLTNSIDRVGLINPPMLEVMEGGHFRVVLGYRRLLAVSNLGWETIPARVLPPNPETGLDRLLLALHDNLATRPLNEMEKARVLIRLAEQGVNRASLIAEYLPLLGLPKNPPTLDRYLRLADLEPEVQRAVAIGQLTTDLLNTLPGMEADDRLAFCQLVMSLRLGRNLQKEFLRMLSDLTRLEGVPIRQLLTGERFQSALSDASLTPSQRVSLLRAELRRRRYPILSRVEERFSEVRKSLRLPPRVAVVPPTNFEGNKYRVSFTFSSQEEFDEAAQALARAAENDAIASLENPLHESEHERR